MIFNDFQIFSMSLNRFFRVMSFSFLFNRFHVFFPQVMPRYAMAPVPVPACAWK